MPPDRHFTATGFVVHNRHVLLHWHPKIQAWLPPGGHLHQNEDPVQAVVREINEETGLKVEIVSTGHQFDLTYPLQASPPLTIMIEDIHDPVTGYHQHIDMIYACKLSGTANSVRHIWQWVSRDDLASGKPLKRQDGILVPPPKDVQLIAEQSFVIVENSSLNTY